MRSFKKLVVMLFTVFCLLLSAICVLAASSESIEVSIPVTNQGHAGTIGLYDKSGTKLLDSIRLDAGEFGLFKVTSDTLGEKNYVIRMMDDDTDDIKYDDTVFDVDVYIEYDARDRLTSVVVVRRKDEKTKESEGVVFRQINDDSHGSSSVGQDETDPGEEETPPANVDPNPNPNPDPNKEEPKLPQTGTLRWLVPYLLISGIVLTILGAICLKAGWRYEE